MIVAYTKLGNFEVLLFSENIYWWYCKVFLYFNSAVKEECEIWQLSLLPGWGKRWISLCRNLFPWSPWSCPWKGTACQLIHNPLVQFNTKALLYSQFKLSLQVTPLPYVFCPSHSNDPMCWTLSLYPKGHVEIILAF